MVPTVFDARANFCKKYSHLPRSNREWPRVVATKIMQLSWGVYHTFANLGLSEENVTTFLTFPLKIPTLHTHYPQIKGAHALLRSDWHWPRVVVTEIMELSEECVTYL